MASVPHDRVERPFRHTRALAAVIVYAAAGLALFLLAAPAFDGREPAVATGVPAVSSPPDQDLLARRALAARAQRGVYAVEGANGGRGSGFVAWVQTARDRSYLITARAVVEGILADGGRAVYVKRGNSFWTGRIARDDAEAGLALIRVDTALEGPLWQRQVDHGSLERGLPATIVPAGPDAGFGEGVVRQARDGFRLDAGAQQLYLGAPVVSPSGRIAGIVVATGPRGRNRIVPIERACEAVRRCS